MKQITKTVQITQYQTDDGRVFDTLGQAEHYEKMKSGIRKVCPSCDGKGRDSPSGDGRDMTTCHYCGGKGWVEKKEIWG
ncbi:hypothetical protein HYP05_gp041 [Salmonella phage ST-W77]|uniref:Uncharacterized protein n=8 Tax=Kuttervirus TaxID=2169536 RepID=A0A678PEJ9_9CAUD|nr:hypothetical protein CBA120_gp117 [Escherichia phage Cba120]YP_009875950.1 hypothetical protein HYP05_gp041 [Salmonella phage ST-W77]YP_009876517.1 hypothetical protein HYP09_gp159 [Salmonella phage BSP101]YP_009887579.1 hypothetical protein HYQ30_gp054 [Salmonella phage heyday]YP_009888778.1 hypothetical protein HYQ36_gp055 [Salmonella phage moki]YP_009948981.1 hypothetical protein HYQ25_gp180 [Salmonella phage Se-B]YP_009966595.1 hypothetical protein HYQ26_gp082 [Salmonella phage Se-G]A